MANNRLYLVNRRLGVRVYIARFAAMGDRWEVIHGMERKLSNVFDSDERWTNWEWPDWELCHEGNMPEGLEEA